MRVNMYFRMLLSGLCVLFISPDSHAGKFAPLGKSVLTPAVETVSGVVACKSKIMLLELLVHSESRSSKRNSAFSVEELVEFPEDCEHITSPERVVFIKHIGSMEGVKFYSFTQHPIVVQVWMTLRFGENGGVWYVTLVGKHNKKWPRVGTEHSS